MKRRFHGRWEGYQVTDLRSDFIAGITVGVIAIPLGMAFAIASGVKPEYGLYTTIIAGALIAILGGSRFQVGGPTGAFIPILLAIVLQYGYENLLLAGMMAGVILVILGIFKLGSVIEFIPRPVTIGFTSGIAVIIFTGQIGNFLGLTHLEQHTSYVQNIKEIVSHLATMHIHSISTGVVCLVILVFMPKFFPRLPASIFGLVISTVFAILFFGDHIPTIGSEFGQIPAGLPAMRFPEISFERIIPLLGPAMTIAFLGAIESLLSAVVADGMTGDKHDSNRELIGQGVANVITPLFGGIPATGAIARTAANIKSGAVSPFSTVFQSIVVLIILLLFAPFASRIPMAAMAPVLMVVAWNMSARHHFIQLLRIRNSDSLVVVTTFLLTVFLNLTIAVGIGLVLASLLFIKRMSEMLVVRKIKLEQDDGLADVAAGLEHDSEKVSIYTVEGPLFFGAAQYFLTTMMEAVKNKPQLVILKLEKMAFIDASGEDNLHSLVRHFQSNNSVVLIAGIQVQPEEMLMRTGLQYRIGKEHFFERYEAAMDYAKGYMRMDKEQVP